jgi:hypothetical protein
MSGFFQLEQRKMATSDFPSPGSRDHGFYQPFNNKESDTNVPLSLLLA